MTIQVKGGGNSSTSRIPKLCIDCVDCNDGSRPHTWLCGKTTSQQFFGHKQQALAHATWKFSSVKNSATCLTAIGSVRLTQSSDVGIPDKNMTTTTQITMAPCSATDPRQLFSLSSAGQLSLATPSPPNMQLECIAAMAMGCDEQRAAASTWPGLLRPYCNTSLPFGARVASLVSAMSLGDKLESLGTGASMDLKTLKVTGPRFNEALHGVEANCGRQTFFSEFGGNNTGCPTSFPHGTALGATFNTTLWDIVGTALSDEVRGFHSQSLAPLVMWSPTDVNMARDGRWGRAQEVASECPFVNGEFGMHMSSALERGRGHTQDSDGYTQVISTAKHFALYTCEQCQ